MQYVRLIKSVPSQQTYITRDLEIIIPKGGETSKLVYAQSFGIKKKPDPFELVISYKTTS